MIEAELPDGTVLEFPEGTGQDVIQRVVKQRLGTSAAQPKARLDAVAPPNWFERQLAKAPSMSPKLESQLRGAAMGFADIPVGTAQLAANAIGQGQRINKAIAEKESQYQAGRQSAGREGLDATRLAGNVGFGMAIPAARSLPGAIGTGTAIGAANPVTEGNFFEEKLKQVGAGAIGGGLGSLAASGISRVLSPVNSAIVKQLRGEGISPTIGQALGGAFNKIEEKATSLPLMGDMISSARQKAQDQFNKATLNKALAPIGEKVDEIGQAGIKQVGDKLSNAIEQANAKIGGVKLDQTFSQELSNLRQLTTGLEPQFQAKFEKILADKLIGKAAPNGGMIADVYQNVSSDLGKEAARFGGMQSSGARDYANAVKELQNMLEQSALRTSPNKDAVKALRAAREGWANLVRIEGAGAAAKGTEGVFTPGQLLNAVRQSDQSVRDRATARGTALMQDWATTGQNVLGNKVPDSGTAGRLGWGIAGASGMVNPLATGAALGGGALAYTQPAQKALVSLAMERPEFMKQLAQALRNNPNALAVPGAVGAQSVAQ